MTAKLRVNLFSDSLLPPKLGLSFSRLTKLALTLLLLLLLANLYYLFEVKALQEHKAELLSQKADYDSQKSSLEQQLKQHFASKSLMDEAELLGLQIALKHRLLGELGEVKKLQSRGYSELLTDLAKIADSRVWLSRIHVIDDSVEFEGFSSEPAQVPDWVERLHRVELLKGQSFKTLTMERGENQPLSFVLTSKIKEESVQ
ncbi:PilN domain-containing protein [Shewanella sp. AS1]|uniref:PilN domain-containing protein n=1 Tax=Shewanella sp. AS1 TaxID=2907626 RepID=UPI001F2155E3|nr:PilN domain-containing protein [Shewanella sp. AS1]MCE9679779.1 PilN domain-containing protein [Shewanella sp. AS1]